MEGRREARTVDQVRRDLVRRHAFVGSLDLLAQRRLRSLLLLETGGEDGGGEEEVDVDAVQ